jgi:hypothetical protein
MKKFEFPRFKHLVSHKICLQFCKTKQKEGMSICTKIGLRKELRPAQVTFETTVRSESRCALRL